MSKNLSLEEYLKDFDELLVDINGDNTSEENNRLARYRRDFDPADKFRNEEAEELAYKMYTRDICRLRDFFGETLRTVHSGEQRVFREF